MGLSSYKRPCTVKPRFWNARKCIPNSGFIPKSGSFMKYFEILVRSKKSFFKLNYRIKNIPKSGFYCIYFRAQTQKVKHSIPRIPQTQFWIYSSDNLYIESMRFFKILIDLKCVWNKFDKNFIFGIWRWNSNPKHWSQYNTHFIIVFSDVRTLPMGSFIKHVYKAGGGGGFPNVHITIRYVRLI